MANTMQPDTLFEASLDGINYAIIRVNGAIWRIGSLIPWRSAISAFSMPFKPEGLKSLADRKIWLAPENPDPPALIAMCCGLGSLWPGAGRELYVNFPIAARAMEEVASLADWDMLALLDEPGMEKFSQTRWQIPYLFMLEYAQWRQLEALGLKPAIFCGHSLGELLALCFAGVYSVKSAWYLLETRAEHMARLEAASDGESGMLAVPAGYEEIAAILAQWPELKISNRNTHRQYILGGPRAMLLEARRQLRRKRVPAVMLNMDLAFHNPAMRILRTVSMLRLNGLDMAKSAIPVRSCVDGQAYPAEKPAICRRIADLDENTVDWVQLMEMLAHEFPHAGFVEFGPQEILCGITSELCPDAVCIPTDKKGHEAQAMRDACAQLFCLGYLSPENIARLAESPPKPGRAYIPAPELENEPQEPLAGVSPEELGIVLSLVADASRKKAEEITPQMDLRQDLSISSSHFPFLMLEAEERLGKPVILENLFRIVTVADLARFLTGASARDGRHVQDGVRPLFAKTREPLQRLVRDGSGKLFPAPYDISRSGIAGPSLGKIAAYSMDDGLKPVLRGLEVLGAAINYGGAHDGESPAGHIFLLKGNDIAGENDFIPILEEISGIAAQTGQEPWICVMGRFSSCNGTQGVLHQVSTWLAGMAKLLEKTGMLWRAIGLVESQHGGSHLDEAGDLLGLELLHGQAEQAIWTCQETLGSPRFCPASTQFARIFPLSECEPRQSGVFQGECQFSLFKTPAMATHGANAAFTPLLWNSPQCLFPESPWLPLSSLFENMRLSAQGHLPDLDVAGFTDFRIFNFSALPEGITRECRISANSRIGLILEDTPVKLCCLGLKMARITANGRKTGDWPEIAEGRCILGSANMAFKALWQPSLPQDGGSREYLDLFYDTLALGRPWQSLQAVARLGPRSWSAALDESVYGNCISAWDLRYGLIDAALLAVLASQGMGAESADALAERWSAWRFASMGVVRFDQPRFPPCRPLRLEWRESWNDSGLRRYDLQAISGDQIIMYILNIEFAPFCAS